jgi:transcriptional regulator with XRE-family HTH domain
MAKPKPNLTDEYYRILDTIVAELRIAMKDKQVSQLELANMSGVSESTISRLFRGKHSTMNISTIVVLYRALDLRCAFSAGDQVPEVRVTEKVVFKLPEPDDQTQYIAVTDARGKFYSFSTIQNSLLALLMPQNMSIRKIAQTLQVTKNFAYRLSKSYYHQQPDSFQHNGEQRHETVPPIDTSVDNHQRTLVGADVS